MGRAPGAPAWTTTLRIDAGSVDVVPVLTGLVTVDWLKNLVANHGH